MKKFLILGILACFIAANASADDGHFRKKHQAFSYSSMEMTGGDETLKSNFGFAFTSTGGNRAAGRTFAHLQPR